MYLSSEQSNEKNNIFLSIKLLNNLTKIVQEFKLKHKIISFILGYVFTAPDDMLDSRPGKKI